MSIEKLAIEKMIYEHTVFNPNIADDAETIKHIKNLLEAFAKALQSSEPVAWQFFQDGKWYFGIETHNHKQNTIDAGFPIRDLFTHPPASVPLEKYNKLLDALKFYDECKFFITHPDGRVELIDHGCVASKAIAEAEGKEG